MPATWPITNDYKVFDDRESVTLTNQAGTTTTSGLTALKETLGQFALSQGEVTVTVVRTKWHLFRGELVTVKPERHGYITDANSVKHYIDENPDLASWDTRWECFTTAQAGAVLQPSL